MPPSVLWFRRDLRLHDHPALLAAAAEGDVVPLFVVDPALWEPAGPPRRAWLVRSLTALAAACDDRLVIGAGDPGAVVPALAAAVGAATVFVSADCGPYGRSRDDSVAAALAAAGRRLARIGTPYAVGPGSVLNGSGRPYQVFTPFSRAWREHGRPAPAGPPTGVRWADGLDGLDGAAGLDGADGFEGFGREGLPPEPDLGPLRLPAAGEEAARERWQHFLENGLAGYAQRRDSPALDGTSGLSAHLKYGEIHPRTLLADLDAVPLSGGSAVSAVDVDTFRNELCWREFYADVLWHRPATAREYLRAEYARMRYEPPGDTFEAWCAGRTGFPIVDAGMRQLQAEGWVHNRVRMIVASFLVKDLHVEWQHGARWFMRWLRDGDLASNQHGWQWVAGSGTDAAPYFRVFNPVSQGLKFDPDGDYVRRYVPELRERAGAAAHEPWKHPDGLPSGYPERIVDHSAERQEALARYGEIKN
jgi:deoxyribodipyrimidine photo-lyase